MPRQLRTHRKFSAHIPSIWWRGIIDQRGAPENARTTELIDPSGWRIQDALPEQWIKVEAAILYVSPVDRTATDPANKSKCRKELSQR